MSNLCPLSADNTKPGGVADTLEGCTAIRRTGEMGWQEPHQVQKKKHKVLHLGKEMQSPTPVQAWG